MSRVAQVLRGALPWAIIGTLVLAMLLRFSTKAPAECVLIAALAVGVGFLVDSLAVQFRTHVLRSWDP